MSQRLPRYRLPDLVPASRPRRMGNQAIKYRQDGSFAQQMVVQLVSADAPRNVIMHTSVSGVRVGGESIAVEVGSVHPNFAPAGSSALNLAIDPPGGRQCL